MPTIQTKLALGGRSVSMLSSKKTKKWATSPLTTIRERHEEDIIIPY